MYHKRYSRDYLLSSVWLDNNNFSCSNNNNNSYKNHLIGSGSSGLTSSSSSTMLRSCSNFLHRFSSRLKIQHSSSSGSGGGDGDASSILGSSAKDSNHENSNGNEMLTFGKVYTTTFLFFFCFFFCFYIISLYAGVHASLAGPLYDCANLVESSSIIDRPRC